MDRRVLPHGRPATPSGNGDVDVCGDVGAQAGLVDAPPYAALDLDRVNHVSVIPHSVRGNLT
jgi:hypothetical protein